MVKPITINGMPLKIRFGVRDGETSGQWGAGFSVGYTECSAKWEMSRAQALQELSNAGWYDRLNPDDPHDEVPDWRSMNKGRRPGGGPVNASIDGDAPFVTLEGSFTKPQLLALLHFHPDEKDVLPPSILERKLHEVNLNLGPRLAQLGALTKRIDSRIAPEVIGTSDKVLWKDAVALLLDIREEWLKALGLEQTDKEGT
jgi:hypothetical protein